MKGLSKRMMKRVAAGALALSLIFTSVGTYNAYADSVDDASTSASSSVEDNDISSDEASIEASTSSEITENEPTDEVIQLENETNLTEENTIEKSTTENTEESTEDENNTVDTVLAQKISFFRNVDNITVSNFNEAKNNLPKTVIGVISFYDETNSLNEVLLAQGYTYDEWSNMYNKDVEIPVKDWVLLAHEDGELPEYTFEAVIVDNAEIDANLQMPTAKVYISDETIIDEYCSHCLRPLTSNRACTGCGKNETECDCEEIDLNLENSSQLAAWLQKYAPNFVELVLDYDDEFYDNLKPNAKEYALAMRDLVNGTVLNAYIGNLSISEALKLFETGKITFETSGFEYSLIANISKENLEALAQYDISLNNVVDYVSAYLGYETESPYYSEYQAGTRNDLLELLDKVTKEVAGEKKRETLKQSIDFVMPEEPTSTTTYETIVTDENSSASIKDIINDFIDNFTLKAYAAAPTAGGMSGEGWYDPGKTTGTGTSTGGSTSEPANVLKATRGAFYGNGFNTYVKRLDGKLAFCIAKNKAYDAADYIQVGKINSNVYGILMDAMSKDPGGSPDDAAVYIPAQLAVWAKMNGQNVPGNITVNGIPMSYGESIIKQLWSGTLQLMALDIFNKYMNMSQTGVVYIYVRKDGADAQPLLVPWTTKPDLTPTEGEPYIEFISGTVEDSDTTTYNTSIKKTSVITNENLSGIKYIVTEKFGENPADSPNVDTGKSVERTTGGDGTASASFEHSASWSAAWVKLDTAGIEAWISTGNASEAFIELYKVYKDAYNSMISEGVYPDEGAAAAYVADMKSRFRQVKYKYEWNEQDSYTRPASSADQNGRSLGSLSLPKEGFRKNITSIDNRNTYANVKDADLTTPSILTTDNVENGGTGSVHMTNQPYRAQFFVNKTDLETNNQIVYDTKFDIYEKSGSGWTQSNYTVVRVTEDIANQMGWGDESIGMYTVKYIGSGYTNALPYGTVYYTQSNGGYFKIVETTAPQYSDGKTGYIGNYLGRDYTRVAAESERFNLSGRTDKTYPTPIAIDNDIAEDKTEHIIHLCVDSDQYDTFMLTDTGISKKAIYEGDYYDSYKGYDGDTHFYVDSTEGTTEGVDKLFYTGKYAYTKLNYSTFVPGDKPSSVEDDKDNFETADMLNKRHGYNNTDFVVVSKPQTSREYSFIDERVKGFIRLTKFDIDAGRYVDGSLDDNYRDGTHHGDADLDGAIYSLYVDDSTEDYNAVQMANGGITHPDGNKTNTAGAADSAQYYNKDGIAVLREQQVFVDTDGDGFCDTWTTQDAVLTPGTKVASAVIRNGELEFDGLYLGNYYIVEEVRSIEEIWGTDENDNEVHDYNYLSFAPGYLAETEKADNGTYKIVKHPYQLTYVDETNYVIKDTTEVSKDTVIKGKVLLKKVTSDETVGSTTNNLDKESGAGFTVFLISELSKIRTGEITPVWSIQQGNQLVENGTLEKLYDDQQQFVGYKLADPIGYGLEGELRHTNRFVFVPKYGYYQMDQILSAYMNETYSNTVPKWGQFANESQAIARVYEDNEELIALFNNAYQFVAGNHVGVGQTESKWWGPSGIGAGYMTKAAVLAKYNDTKASLVEEKAQLEKELEEIKSRNQSTYECEQKIAKCDKDIAIAERNIEFFGNRTDVQTSREYVLSELFTNTKGQIKIPQLAWGAYLIVETTVPENKGVADPVFVTISDTTDDNSVTTAEPPYNLPITVYNGTKYRVRIVKRDAQSGQNVLLANTKFRIYDYQKQDYVRLTVAGSAGIATSSMVFSTDNSGFINYDSLSMLEIGKYRLEEIEGPEGFWNAYWDYGNPSDKNVTFKEDKLGFMHYTIDAKQGHELTLDPNGNVTTSDGANTNQANMKQEYFGTVDFEVTTDRKWVSAGLVSSVLTTDNNTDILYIGESYHNSETLGMLTIMKTGEVLVGYDNTKGIEYSDEYKDVTDELNNQDKTYKKRNDFNENVEKFDIGTDRDTTQTGLGASYEGTLYTNDTEEASYEYDDETYDFVYEERPLANAVFQIIAAENIYSQDNQYNEDGSRSTWFKKGDVVATVVTAREGEEMDVIPTYKLADGVTENFNSVSTVTGETFTQSYTNKDFETTGGIDNKWIESRMSDLDKAIFGVPAFTDETIYPNSYVNEQGERQVVVRVIKDGTLGQVSVLLPLGKYTVKEIEAPYGYVLPENSEFDTEKTDMSIDVEFTWKDQIKEVVFNTDKNSTYNTAQKIKSFMARNLAWWHGDINKYVALEDMAEIGVSKDQVTKEITSRVFDDKRGTFTDKWIAKDAPTIIGEAEIQYYTDEQGFINFYNERVKPQADKEGSKKYVSVGIYKLDQEDNKIALQGAKFGLYTKDDIYNVDGVLLVPADTRLAVATTDENGFAEFEVDIPYKSLHVEDKKEQYDADGMVRSIDGNTATNTGSYYIKELTPPVGYLYNDTIVTETLDKSVDLTFDPYTYENDQHDKVMFYPVYAEQTNLKTEVDISKRDIVNEKEIEGAKLEVYEVFGPEGGRVVYTETGDVDWTKCTLSDVLESWTSEQDKTHVIRGLKLSNREHARLDNSEIREHVYLLREVAPAPGYVTARDIVFEIVQNYDVEDGKAKWDIQNNTVWVLNDVTIPYATGAVKAQPYYTDHDDADIYNYNHDYHMNTNDAAVDKDAIVSDGVTNDIKKGAQDGNAIANYVLVDGTLVIDIENDATLEAIQHAFSAKRIIQALDKVSPDADAQYVKTPTSKDVTSIYFVPNVFVNDEIFEMAKSNLLYQDEEGTFTNIFTEDMFVDELPEGAANWLDMEKLDTETVDDPELVIVPRFDWQSCNDAYTDRQDLYTKVYGGEQLDHKPERAVERTIVMDDERTKVYISKADITTDKEVVGATIVITNSDGEVVDEWVSDGEDHYIERLPIGDYTLTETQAPNADGYVVTADIKFTVEDDGHINYVYMPDNYTRLKITKSDIVTGERVIGAELEIISLNEEAITYEGETYEYEEVIRHWTTEDEDTYIDRLPTGKYKLVETYAPTDKGYTSSNEIEFEIKDEDVVTKVDMKDDFTVTEIAKTDIVTGEDVEGAELKLFIYVPQEIEEEIEEVEENAEVDEEIDEEEDEPVYDLVEIVSWKTGDKDSVKVADGYDFVKPEMTSAGKIVLNYLPVASYMLVETTPADGYVTANSIEFEVTDKLYHYADDKETVLRDTTGLAIANEIEINKVEMKDDFTVAQFSKTDIVNGKEIAGAKLEIYQIKVDEEGQAITEIKKDENGNAIKDENGKDVLAFVKIDNNAETEEIEPMYSWTSGSDGTNEDGTLKPHVIERIPVGKYVLVETFAPDGYMIAEEVPFEITDKFYHYKDKEGLEINEVNGKVVVNEDEIVKVEMKDERALIISKQNIVTGQEIEGAELAIYEYVADTKEELVTPVADDAATDGSTQEDASSTEDTSEVVENAQEGTTSDNNQTPAETVVKEHDYSNDTPIESWTSGKLPHGVRLENLEVGKEYVLVETMAPDGYFVANNIRFKLENNSESDLPDILVFDATSNEYKVNTERQIIMKDDVTRAHVQKVDQSGNYVKGAELAIYAYRKDALGFKHLDKSAPVATWTTNGNYTDILALPVGNYQLVEVKAPAGYRLASPIDFEVTEDNKSGNPVIVKMVDIYAPGNTPDTPDTPETPTETPETPVTPEQPQQITVTNVQTGDTNVIVPFVLGGISLVIALVFAVLAYKKKDEDEVVISNDDVDKKDE